MHKSEHQSDFIFKPETVSDASLMFVYGLLKSKFFVIIIVIYDAIIRLRRLFLLFSRGSKWLIWHHKFEKWPVSVDALL